MENELRISNNDEPKHEPFVVNKETDDIMEALTGKKFDVYPIHNEISKEIKRREYRINSLDFIELVSKEFKYNKLAIIGYLLGILGTFEEKLDEH